MWFLLDVPVMSTCSLFTVFLYFVLLSCPLLCLPFSISRAVICEVSSNKAPSVYLSVGGNDTWVPSDVWNMGHRIQGSREDV